MLYLIGIGVGDFTVRGLAIARNCRTIFAEIYTSVIDIPKLELQLGKKIQSADRDLIERNADTLLAEAKEHDVALLIAGDPLLATTHIDLLLRAQAENIRTEVINHCSIFSLVARTGLQLYKFGKTTSIPFPEKNFKSTTPYSVFKQNQSIDAHTLFLLDLRPTEQRYLTIPEAIALLREMSEGKLPLTTMAIGGARLGMPNECVRFGMLQQLIQEEFGEPPYCLIIPAKLHFTEREFLDQFKRKERKGKRKI
ncbi:MAG TPA: diphthine synthase [Candidatus Nanoarchaeia archaeon]|nr:diphthine synthase [Candidatus Nanoarchaeia archaeon]